MTNEESRAYQRAWYAKNKDKCRADSRERMRKWRKENPTQARAACKKWREKNQETVRNSNLIRAYGISSEEFDRLFASQGKQCGICRGDTTAGKHWHVDHCHQTERVRGILCSHCNLMLGHARDRADVLKSAIFYLSSA